MLLVVSINCILDCRDSSSQVARNCLFDIMEATEGNFDVSYEGVVSSLILSTTRTSAKNRATTDDDLLAMMQSCDAITKDYLQEGRVASLRGIFGILSQQAHNR